MVRKEIVAFIIAVYAGSVEAHIISIAGPHPVTGYMGTTKNQTDCINLCEKYRGTSPKAVFKKNKYNCYCVPGVTINPDTFQKKEDIILKDPNQSAYM